MQIKTGTTRTVLLLPFFGVAMKFARIDLMGVFKFLWYCATHKRLKNLKWYFSYSHEAIGSFSNHMTHGIRMNLSEYRFYKQTRNLFAWPTHFSFFGFFNIQPLGIVISLSETAVQNMILEATNREIKDPHCFGDIRNYCSDKEGNIFLLDYASRDSQEVLVRDEKNLVRIFHKSL